MRTTKELLIILRDHLENGGRLRTGLCGEIVCFPEYNDEERREVLSFIHFHRPTSGKHFNDSYQYSAFYWPWGDREPRIAWLNELIENFD